MKKYLLLLILAVLAAGCGPLTVNTPSFAANRKMAFVLDNKGRFTFLPEAKTNAVYLSDMYGNFLTAVTPMDRICGWCDFSPSNDMILFVERVVSDKPENAGEEIFNIIVYNLKTESEKLVFQSSSYVWFPRWSPNGKYFAFCAEGSDEIKVVNWRTFEIIRVKSNSVFYRWLPDATGLLTVDILDEIDTIEGDTLQYFVIRRVYFDAKEEAEDLIRGYSRACWPDLSSDGNKIAFNAVEFSGPSSFLVDKIDARENVYMYDYKSKEVSRLTKGGMSAFYAVISPDGAKVAFVDCEEDFLGGGDVWICSLQESKPKLKRIWSGDRALYPMWIENDILGFISLDKKDEKGQGFDDIRIYNLANASLTSLKKQIQDRFKPRTE